MKQHIRIIAVDGWWHHCLTLSSGALLIMCRIGRVGDCIRP